MCYFFQANFQKIAIFFNGPPQKISIFLVPKQVNVYLGKVTNFWGILISKIWRNWRIPLGGRESTAAVVNSVKIFIYILGIVGIATTKIVCTRWKVINYLPYHFVHGDCINHVQQLVIKDELLEIKNLVKSCRTIFRCDNISSKHCVSLSLTDHFCQPEASQLTNLFTNW